VAECQPRLERAGAGAPTPARGGESAVAAGAPRRASRPRRPAPCGPLLAPLPACLGRLFPASAGTARAPQGHPGHRPYAGALGLEPVPTRQCLCPPGHGRRRSAVPRAEEPHHGPTSPGLRLSPGARRISGSIRSATVVRSATAARTSAQALGHHVWRGPGQRGVRTAWPQRVDPPRGASQAAPTSQTTSHCPPEPSNLIGKFLGRAGLSSQPHAVRSNDALGQRLAAEGRDALRVRESSPASAVPRRPRARGMAERACCARPAAWRTGGVPLSQIDTASLTLRRSATRAEWRTTRPSHRTPVRSPSLAAPCGRGPRSFSLPPQMWGGIKLAES
jgi:hypothetical protein